jgi:hypothetical protein
MLLGNKTSSYVRFYLGEFYLKFVSSEELRWVVINSCFFSDDIDDYSRIYWVKMQKQLILFYLRALNQKKMINCIFIHFNTNTKLWKNISE